MNAKIVVFKKSADELRMKFLDPTELPDVEVDTESQRFVFKGNDWAFARIIPLDDTEEITVVNTNNPMHMQRLNTHFHLLRKEFFACL